MDKPVGTVCIKVTVSDGTDEVEVENILKISLEHWRFVNWRDICGELMGDAYWGITEAVKERK